MDLSSNFSKNNIDKSEIEPTNWYRHSERTAHLFYHCTVATNLLNQLKLHVNSYLQDNDPQEQIHIYQDTILFDQTTMAV